MSEQNLQPANDAEALMARQEATDMVDEDSDAELCVDCFDETLDSDGDDTECTAIHDEAEREAEALKAMLPGNNEGDGGEIDVYDGEIA